jgi:hypothetical protein
MSDVFRRSYRELTAEENALVDSIKDTAGTLYDLIAGDPATAMDSNKARALALAKTKLEESVMWAVKGITG